MMPTKPNHFLDYIQIKNFKCFDDFKAEGLQRVNLIGGKNNVGKTAFMEACYINVYAQNIKSFNFALSTIKEMRENLNILSSNQPVLEFLKNNIQFFIEQTNHIETQSNINSASYNIKEQAGMKKYHFEFNNKKITVNVNDFSFEIMFVKNVNFIDNFGLSNDDIIRNFGAIQTKDAEPILNSIVNEFDPRIEAFKVINDKPCCKVNGHYVEISEFGDGLRHLISIVVTLYRCENGYLFIDEIDNGIHYTMLARIWEIILTISKELNVQVFATTHSKECIEAYYHSAKKLADQDISFIRLSRLKSGEIKAGVHNYELLENSIEQEHEVRGW